MSAVHSGLFDALGHPDYLKRWLVPHIDPSAFAAAPELYEPVLVALVETGMALEVNSSGLRQAAHEAYPSPWVVERFRQLGGRRVTAGSDAHRAHSFGTGIPEVYAAIAAAGLEEVWIRRGDSSATVRLPGLPRA